MWRSKILWKLYAGYAVVIVVAMSLVGLLFGQSVERNTLSDVDRKLESEARLLAEVACVALSSGLEDDLQRRITALGESLESRLTLIAADGTVLADSDEDPERMDNHIQRPELLAATNTGVGRSTRFSRTLSQRARYTAVPFGTGEQSGFARTAIPLTVLDQRLSQVRGAVYLIAAVATVVGLLLGWVVSRRFTWPLRLLSTTAGAIAEGNYERRVAVNSQDELGDLAQAFNKMSSALREAVFTANADRVKLSAILASMVEGVVAVDRDERVVHMNEIAGKLLQVRPEQSLGRPIWELTRIREIPESLSSTMRNGDVDHRVVQLPGGADRFFEIHTSPLRSDDDGLPGGDGVAGAVMVLDDVTLVRRLERVRQDFVANVSHELKTPVTAIRGFVETLLDDPDAPAEVRRRFLGKMNIQSQRLSSLVADLLSLSRLETQENPLEYEPVDVYEVIDEALHGLQPQREQRASDIVLDLQGDELMVSGEPEALRQAVANLLENAMRYSPRESPVTLRAYRQEKCVTIEVEDKGPGIEPQHHGRLFERFYRVDAARSRELGGTGLGLAIVKHIVLALGGEISLRSVPGEGSTFRIDLPAVD